MPSDDALAYYNLGLAFEQNGDAAAAQDAFQHALRLDPKLKVSAPGLPAKK